MELGSRPEGEIERACAEPEAAKMLTYYLGSREQRWTLVPGLARVSCHLKAAGDKGNIPQVL